LPAGARGPASLSVRHGINLADVLSISVGRTHEEMQIISLGVMPRDMLDLRMWVPREATDRAFQLRVPREATDRAFQLRMPSAI